MTPRQARRTLLPLGLGLATGAAYGVLGPGAGAGDEVAALVVAGLGTLLFVARAWRTGLGGWARPLTLLLGAWAFCASQGWFHGHPRTGIHPTDFFHYQAGARFAPELGYRHLYVCTLAALQDDGVDTSGWKVRRLEDDLVVPAPSLSTEVTSCRQAFAPERWRAFGALVREWRLRVGPRATLTTLQDHGFNGTPAWLLAPRALLAAVGDTPGAAYRLVWVDPVLVAGAGVLLLRAFGPTGFALAMLTLGVHAPSRWDWVGGSLLRMDWWALGAVALWALKRRRGWLAGAAQAFAMLLRVFPGLALLGLAGGAVARVARPHPSWRFTARTLAAAGAATLVLVATSAWLGPDGAWDGFLRNLAKHTSRPGFNVMGLGMALSHVPGLRLADLPPGTSPEAWGELRAAALKDERPRVAVVTLAAMTALAWTARRRARPAPEKDAAAGWALMPLLLNASSYYSSALALTFPLGLGRRLGPLTFAIVLLAGQLLQATTRTNDALHADTYFAVHSALDVALVVTLVAGAALTARQRTRPAAPTSQQAA